MKIPCDICVYKDECEYEKIVRDFLPKNDMVNVPHPLQGGYICQKSSICKIEPDGKTKFIPLDVIKQHYSE